MLSPVRYKIIFIYLLGALLLVNCKCGFEVKPPVPSNVKKKPLPFEKSLPVEKSLPTLSLSLDSTVLKGVPCNYKLTMQLNGEGSVPTGAYQLTTVIQEEGANGTRLIYQDATNTSQREGEMVQPLNHYTAQQELTTANPRFSISFTIEPAVGVKRITITHTLNTPTPQAVVLKWEEVVDPSAIITQDIINAMKTENAESNSLFLSNLDKLHAGQTLSPDEAAFTLSKAAGLASGDTSLIEALLKLPGMEVNTHTKNWSVPLSYVRTRSIAEFLLSRGAEVDHRDEQGNTPLMEAAHHGDDEIVALLLEKGADINRVNRIGNTALHMAASYCNLATLQKLIDLGANVNISNNKLETPLHEAVQRDVSEYIETLIRAGALLNPRDSQGRTPLFRAIQFKKNNSFKALRKHGAKS